MACQFTNSRWAWSQGPRAIQRSQFIGPVPSCTCEVEVTGVVPRGGSRCEVTYTIAGRVVTLDGDHVWMEGEVVRHCGPALANATVLAMVHGHPWPRCHTKPPWADLEKEGEMWQIWRDAGRLADAKREVERARREEEKERAEQLAIAKRRIEAGFVYLLTDGTAYKVGHTTRTPAERASGCQVGNPRPVEVVDAIAGGTATERAIHCELDDIRLRGEWFDLSPRVPAAFRSRYLPDALLARPELADLRRQLDAIRAVLG